ncbi:MAG: 3-oxoacyl-ACP synthase [Bacteroidota bacterium]
MSHVQLKELLYQQCLDYVQKRMDAAEQGIKEAQQASKDDTKSSAGDKYETGRAMMQQETDRNMAQLNEANKLKVALNQISTSVTTKQVENGSVVLTNNGNFYMAISAGTLLVDSLSYFAISPASPIGLKLKGLKATDQFTLNGKDYKITSVL